MRENLGILEPAEKLLFWSLIVFDTFLTPARRGQPRTVVKTDKIGQDLRINNLLSQARVTILPVSVH